MMIIPFEAHSETLFLGLLSRLEAQDYDVLDYIDAKLRIGGETTRQGSGGEPPPLGQGELGV